MEWLNIIIGAVSGGALVSLLTLPSAIKKAKAEARAAEADNTLRVAEGWKQLADERQEANAEKDRIIAEKDAKIDALYMQIGEIRHERDEQIEENTKLRVQIAANTPKICERRGCPDRTPPTGY